MFSGRPSVPLSVRASVRDSCGSFMFPRYLQYLLTDFRQTFVTGASRDSDELIRFWGQKVKVQGHIIATEAHSTRRYRWVQLFLVFFLLMWSRDLVFYFCELLCFLIAFQFYCDFVCIILFYYYYYYYRLKLVLSAFGKLTCSIRVQNQVTAT